MSCENYGDKLRDKTRSKIADKVTDKVAPHVTGELVKFSDAADEADVREFISDGTKAAFDLATGTKTFDETLTFARDKTCSKIADKVTEKVAPHVTGELVKFSDEADEADVREFISDGTKAAFDLATGTKTFDETLTFARDKTRSKIADKVTEKVAPHVTGELVKFSDEADEADVREFISDGTKAAFDLATGTKTFDETLTFARDKTCSKIADKVTEKVAPHVTGELVKFSDEADEADVREFISDGTKAAFDLATGTKTFDETLTFARDKTRSKIADKVTEKVAPHVTGELVKFSDAADEADVCEFISDGTKAAFDLATGTKTFDETLTFARDKTRSKIADKVTEKVAPHVTGELVKFSDAAVEQGYKVSCELAEVVLPPELSRKVGRQLKISTEQIKRKHADNLNDAAVEIFSSSTKILFDAATGTKDFDEACEEIFSQTKVTVKNVVIERGKQVALDEAKRIGGQVVGNAAIDMLILGNQMKDSVLRLLDGEIDLERYIFEVNRACLALAIKLVEKNSLKLGQGLIPIPVVGAVVGSAVISVACRGLMIAADAVLTKVENGVRQVKKMWNAADNQAAADRRKVVSKIKSDALAEMNRQRAVMQKYFADEKLTWDSNVQGGFELIARGTYSNDVEVIAQGLDKILQNFGSKVAFDNREDFRKKFRQRKIVVNL